jgi:hypothetical protein
MAGLVPATHELLIVKGRTAPPRSILTDQVFMGPRHKAGDDVHCWLLGLGECGAVRP